MNTARSELAYLRPTVRPSSGTGHWHPGFEHGRAVARAARETAGAVVDLATGLTLAQANRRLERRRKRPSVAFQPVGSFEARKNKCADGTFLVQVRHVGQPAAGGAGHPGVTAR